MSCHWVVLHTPLGLEEFECVCVCVCVCVSLLNEYLMTSPVLSAVSRNSAFSEICSDVTLLGTILQSQEYSMMAHSFQPPPSPLSHLSPFTVHSSHSHTTRRFSLVQTASSCPWQPTVMATTDSLLSLAAVSVLRIIF